MKPETYVIVNSEGVCENKIIWDGVTEWFPPPDLLTEKEVNVGISIEIGDPVICDISV